MKKILILLFISFSCFSSEQQQLSLNEKTELFARIKQLPPELQQHINSYVSSFSDVKVKSFPCSNYQQLFGQYDELAQQHSDGLHSQTFLQKKLNRCWDCHDKRKQIMYWDKFNRFPAVNLDKGYHMFTPEGNLFLGYNYVSSYDISPHVLYEEKWVGPNKNGLIIYDDTFLWVKKASWWDRVKSCFTSKRADDYNNGAGHASIRAMHRAENEWLDVEHNNNSCNIANCKIVNNQVMREHFRLDDYKLIAVDYDYEQANPSKKYIIGLTSDALLFLELENEHYTVVKEISFKNQLNGAQPLTINYYRKNPFYKAVYVGAGNDHGFGMSITHTLLINTQTHEIKKYEGRIGFCQSPNYLTSRTDQEKAYSVYNSMLGVLPPQFFSITNESLFEKMALHDNAKKIAMQKYVKSHPKFYLQIHQPGKKIE